MDNNNIKDFKGKKYDQKKLNNFFVTVDEKIEKIEQENQKIFNAYLKRLEKMTEKERQNARPPQLKGYCTWCGAVRPSGDIGIGGGCEKITDNFKDSFISQFYPEKLQDFKNDYFEAYKKYAKYARALFLHNNKKAKNDFLKSFFASLENNKMAKLSKKQISIIEKNADFKGYAEKLTNYKKFVFFKYGFLNKNLFYSKLDYNKDFWQYCRIQYAKAWIKE